MFLLSTMKTPTPRMKPLSTIEQEVLIELVEKFKKDIESKRNDTRSIETKKKLWIEISNTFSSAPGTEKRDSKQLKKSWENLKMKAKKTVAHQKKERVRTGGGSFVPELDATTERIESMIPEQMHPLRNQFDDDAEMNEEDKENRTDANDNNGTHLEIGEEVSVIKPTTKSSNTPDFAQAKERIVLQSDLEHQKKIELLDLQLKCTLETHHKQMELMELQKELVRAQIRSLATPAENDNSAAASLLYLPTYQNL